ncbi:MAG: adaptor protein MecA [Eubacteriales bacterium]|nr:adaptor protein MecA [Eubacteriales bacterium]
MKLEKINENQIRCTLTREDLENHKLRLSELAYGTEKAKQLFRDMMQQAQIQFGFEADNIPLMIEAIPISSESIVLIITKVDDPEELDTRFSKFAPYKNDTATADPFQLDGADNILDLFQKLRDAKGKTSPVKPAPAETKVPESETESAPVNLLRLYLFHSLDEVIAAAKALAGAYAEPSILYKDSASGDFLLIIHQGEASPELFNKVCNILTEYGDSKPLTPSGEAYIAEHRELISENPLLLLASL